MAISAQKLKRTYIVKSWAVVIEYMLIYLTVIQFYLFFKKIIFRF